MRSKILYLITSIFLLVSLTNCEDSLTATTNPDKQEELPTPELVSPTNNSTNQSTQVELNWKRIKGAKDYKIQLSKSEDFESTLVDSMIDRSSYTTPNLETETTYFWRVKPFKRNYEGPWSEVWQFTTSSGDVEPATVELISPDNDTVLKTEMPAFEWSSVSESADYHYQLSKDADFNNLVEDSVLGSTNFELVLSDSGGTYYWRVSPILDSTPSEWSEVFHFTKEGSSSDSTDLVKPVQVLPSNNATGVSLQPTFEWEVVDGADYYILHSNSVDPTEMVIETEVEGTTFTPETALATQTSHDWRVRAVSGDTKGEWSEIHSFTTGSGSNDSDNNTTVTLTSPSDGAGSQSTSPFLDWESISGINEYQVQLATDNSFSSPVVDQAVTQTSYDVSSLNHSQTYYWRVQANGDGDTGNWSAVYSFTTESDSNDDTNSGDYANSVEGDRQALMDLYEATGGSSWSNDSGWGSGNPDGSWHGVEVNSQGRVVRLNLRANGLNGQLPESIGNLSRVRYFNVKQNSLSGSIPSSIGQMSSLTHLLLNGRKADMNTVDPLHPGKPAGGSWSDERSNNFTGQIPESIGNLTNLEWLELNGTGRQGEGLEGAVPSSIGNLTKLKGLQLDFNRLTSFPASMGNLRNLIHLALGHQGHDGNGNYVALEGYGFPQWIGQLSNLKFLWMENNDGIGGQLPDMSALTDLEIILLDFNGLTGEIPQEFYDGTMPNINMTQLAWNNFSGTMPEIREPNNLAAFTIEGNGITGEIPDSWGTSAASSIINFGLGWNDLEGEIPNLSHMSRLRYLRANDNNFTGDPPMVDTSNDALQFMDLRNNELGTQVDPDLAEVGNLPKFRELDLRNNPLTNSDLEPLIDALESDGNLDVLTY